MRNNLSENVIGPQFIPIVEPQLKLIKKILGGSEFTGLMRFFIGLILRCLELEKETIVTNCNGLDDLSVQLPKKYFVVFLTRRCHVLEEIFWKIIIGPSWDSIFNIFFSNVANDFPTVGKLSSQEEKMQKLCEIVKNIHDEHYITDTALSAMSGDFALAYEKDELPTLIIADELLIHGRAVNRLLLRLEENIVAAYQWNSKDRDKGGAKQEEENLRNEFLKKLSIHIYARNSDMILLLPRYEKRIDVSDLSKVCDPDQWRGLSMRLSKLISVFDVGNVAFSWCFRRIVDSQCQLPEGSEEFQKVHTEMYESRIDTYILLYPNKERPQAICTVRRKLCGVSDKKGGQLELLIPFTVYDHLKWENEVDLHKAIVHDLEQENSSKDLLAFFKAYDEKLYVYPNSEEIYLRRIAETNELMINSLLVRRYFALVEKQVDSASVRKDWIKQINLDQIARNFATTTSCSNDIKNALGEIWDVSPKNKLERYLNILLKGVPPIEENLLCFGSGEKVRFPNTADSQDMLQCQKVYYAVQDAIAEVGYEADQNAYLNSSSQTSLSDEILSEWGNHHSLGTLLCKCEKRLKEYFAQGNGAVELTQVLAVLVHAMDYGLVGMNAVAARQPMETCNEVPLSPVELYTEIRAGEQALFIWPIRYKDFLEILGRIEWHGRDYKNASIAIKDFVKALDMDFKIDYEKDAANENLAQRLCEFYREVKSCGHRFIDWLFVCQVDDDLDYHAKELPDHDATVKRIWERINGLIERNDYRNVYNSIR